jgi:hypothetical protein
LRRPKRDAPRGSPRSFATQKTLAQDDNEKAIRRCDVAQFILLQMPLGESNSGIALADGTIPALNGGYESVF